MGAKGEVIFVPGVREEPIAFFAETTERARTAALDASLPANLLEDVMVALPDPLAREMPAAPEAVASEANDLSSDIQQEAEAPSASHALQDIEMAAPVHGRFQVAVELPAEPLLVHHARAIPTESDADDSDSMFSAMDPQQGFAGRITFVSTAFDQRASGPSLSTSDESGRDAPHDSASGFKFGTVPGTGYESSFIDTLMSGLKIDPQGQTVKYYLAGDADFSEFYSGYTTNDVYEWSAADKTAVAQMFQLYENVTGLDFELAANYNDANIVWWQSDSTFFDDWFNATGFIGMHEFPGAGTIIPQFGVFDTKYMHKMGMAQGADGFQTLMHELGHGLGLAHPHDGFNGNEHFPGVFDSGDLGDFEMNQNIWTEMSYNRGWTEAPWNGGWGGNGTPMALDIAALQHMYGANASFANGNSTYLLPTANKAGTFWSAIWDTGGTDTIDGSLATKSVFVNLNDADLTGEHAGGYVSWQKGIGGGFTIANGVFIENATGGKGADFLTGNDKANTLTGNAGNDTLDGGVGGDKMEGGAGDDTYFVDDAADTITEAAKGGTDTIWAGFDVDLVFDTRYQNQEIENLFALDGSGPLELAGNALKNSIAGAGGDDELHGDSGDDTINGGAGEDEIHGNDGKDTLFGGTEDDWLLGGDGADKLDGGAGDDFLDPNEAASTATDGDADVLTGGIGDDTYVVYDAGDKIVESITNAKGGGFDTVSALTDYSLAKLANVDAILLVGATGFENLNAVGNALNNTLTGNKGDNILDGGKGEDVLIGGDGNDTYFIDLAVEALTGHIVEGSTPGSGSDTIVFSFPLLTQIDNVENYTNTGKLDWSFDFSGDADNHALTGGAGNDTLTGGDADDVLDGGKSGKLGDSLTGGTGNDTYVVDSLADQVHENVGDSGDTVVINRDVDLNTDFGGVIENVTLSGKAAINATGDGGANILTGNDGKNTLDGGGGADTIVGGAGDDKMTGGGDADVFDYNHLADKGKGKDVITDFDGAEGDTLDVHDLLVEIGGTVDPFGSGFLQVIASKSGLDAVVQIDADGGGNKFTTLVTLTGEGGNLNDVQAAITL